MPAVVRFICVASAHPPQLFSLDFGLTVHLRDWAFCPAGEARGHEWRRIEGVPLEALTAPYDGDAVVAAD
jgi:hypothetical protein